MTHRNEALRLAELGWHIFALGPTGKPYPNCKSCAETCGVAEDYEKCDHLLCHATYAGTTETARLTAMWERLPKSLVGLRTGAPSGLIVLDFDQHSADKDGLATLREYQSRDAFPHTVTARSGGGGYHLFFQHPGKPTPNDNNGKLGPGLDVKADGGFVILPPSAKRDRPEYRWLNSPFTTALAELHSDLLAPLWREVSQPQRRSSEGSLSPGETSKNFEEAVELLRVTGEGSRNENLYRAACRGGEVIAAGLASLTHVNDLLVGGATSAGMSARDGIKNTIRSGLNRGMNDYKESE